MYAKNYLLDPKEKNLGVKEKLSLRKFGAKSSLPDRSFFKKRAQHPDCKIETHFSDRAHRLHVIFFSIFSFSLYSLFHPLFFFLYFFAFLLLIFFRLILSFSFFFSFFFLWNLFFLPSSFSGFLGQYLFFSFLEVFSFSFSHFVLFPLSCFLFLVFYHFVFLCLSLCFFIFVFTLRFFTLFSFERHHAGRKL